MSSPTHATPAALRALADLVEETKVTPTVHGWYLNLTGDAQAQREAFRALRARPGATVDDAQTSSMFVGVAVPVGETTVNFVFDRSTVGSKRTVVRAVEEFVFDDEPESVPA